MTKLAPNLFFCQMGYEDLKTENIFFCNVHPIERYNVLNFEFCSICQNGVKFKIRNVQIHFLFAILQAKYKYQSRPITPHTKVAFSSCRELLQSFLIS